MGENPYKRHNCKKRWVFSQTHDFEFPSAQFLSAEIGCCRMCCPSIRTSRYELTKTRNSVQCLQLVEVLFLVLQMLRNSLAVFSPMVFVIHRTNLGDWLILNLKPFGYGCRDIWIKDSRVLLALQGSPHFYPDQSRFKAWIVQYRPGLVLLAR